MLIFRLGRPAKVLVTIYGPGPSCNRLGTFSRRGQLGVNRVRFSGSLFGRPLAPGRYAVVVEAWRGGKRVWMGRVLVVILARDGREGGNRPLAAPDCDGNTATVTFLASGGGNFGQLASSGDAAAGGVAGVSAGRGDGDGEGDSLLPQLPALPTIPTVPLGASFDFPAWTLPALAIFGALGAAAVVAFGFRRYREDAGGWD